MATKAHLDPIDTNEPIETRRSGRRRSLRLETNGVLAGGASANVTVHNISAAGLLIETGVVPGLTLGEGDRLSLDLPEAGLVDAIVVWASGRLYGCAFEQALSESALAATQLRSDITVPRSKAPDQRGISAVRQSPPEPLGIKLARLRRERRLTLAQVAGALGVSKPTVWAWEKSKARPVPDRIPQIAEVLGVSAGELGEAAASDDSASLVEDCRIRIAAAYQTEPANIRIMVEI